MYVKENAEAKQAGESGWLGNISSVTLVAKEWNAVEKNNPAMCSEAGS
jgi:hypothetical protein